MIKEKKAILKYWAPDRSGLKDPDFWANFTAGEWYNNMIK